MASNTDEPTIEAGTGRQNIESLYSEIRELEAAFKRAKQASPTRERTKQASAVPKQSLDFSVLSRPDRAEDADTSVSNKFVKSQVDPLREEIRMMEADVRRKDQALIALSSEVATAKDKAQLLQRELESKNRVIHALIDEKKSLLDVDAKNQYSIKRLEKELHEAHRRAELQRSARSSRLGGMAATTALYESRFDELEAELRKKTDEVQSLGQKNEVLVETMRKYDKALELLKAIASDGGDKTALQEKLRSLSALKPPIANMSLGVEMPTDVGSTIKALTEETRAQKAELASLTDKYQVAEKTGKAQHQRIIYLTDRLDFISARLKDGAQRRSILNDAGTLEAHARAAAKSAPERYALGAEPMVPAALLDFVEREVGVLNAQLHEVEETLVERVEASELLQRRLDVLEHAKEADTKRFRREAHELREEIAALQAQLASLDKQSVEREIELKREKFELKSKLEKMIPREKEK